MAPPRLLQWGRNLSVAETRPEPALAVVKRMTSMGPQPLSRGNHSGNGASERCQRTSMGPQPLSRGNSPAATASEGRGRTSMGPQPLSRGNYETKGDFGPLPKTSMGPQPLSRGNHREVLAPVSLVPHFNGAATSQSRKPDVDVHHPDVLVHFNGAATSQSRKPMFRRPKQYRTRTSMGPQPLSRGNNAAGLPSGPRASTSMGPQPLSRGNVELWPDQAMDGQLQWGRNLSVAETSKSPASKYVTILLQWGRNLSVAETEHGHLAGNAALGTSMGPQPLSRGNMK